MERKISGMSAGVFKFLFCAVFFILLSGTAFAQVPGLTLSSSDIRWETAYSNNNAIAGYNLYVRKKPGIESVMLTEPTGNYALRTLVMYETNGYERRELSGKPLSDLYSRYSILSSTPINDGQFGRAFKLFIPSTIVYGNPSSASGPVYLDIIRGAQLNIRTFEYKYGDPNRGRYQNNLAILTPPVENILEARYYEFVPVTPSPDNADVLRKELLDKIEKGGFLDGYDEDLRKLLLYMFWEMERR